jgi:hypothetical protein
MKHTEEKTSEQTKKYFAWCSDKEPNLGEMSMLQANTKSEAWEEIKKDAIDGTHSINCEYYLFEIIPQGHAEIKFVQD